MDNKRVCLITGGSRGIGKAICKRLADENSIIAFTHYDADENAAQETTAELEALGAEVAVYYFDISDYAETAKMVGQIVEKYGRIDVLINNAGIIKDALLVRMSEAVWDQVLDVNLKSVFNASQAVAKVMMKQRAGKIVSVASVVGAMGNVGQANYVASKAGIIGLTKTLAKELAPRGVNVNCIAPGFIESDMTAKLPEKVIEGFLKAIPMGRMGSTDEVADVVEFLVSDQATYVTGQTIHINGGLYM